LVLFIEDSKKTGSTARETHARGSSFPEPTLVFIDLGKDIRVNFVENVK
jgi:hypothetical protein